MRMHLANCSPGDSRHIAVGQSSLALLLPFFRCLYEAEGEIAIIQSCRRIIE